MTSRLGRKRPLVIVGLAMSSAVVVGAASAPAAEESVPRAIVTHEATMVVTGFDEEVARANGYEIRTAPDGTRFSAPASSSRRWPSANDSQASADGGLISPQNTVTGACGSSFVNAYHPRGIATGFTIVPPRDVLYRVWGVTSVAHQSHDENLSGGPSSHSWATAYSIPMYVGQRVVVTSRLNSNAHVLLADGSLCTAGRPFAVRSVP